MDLLNTYSLPRNICSIYEQWPVKCCGVYSWHYLSSKTDYSCASVYIMCCSVEVLQLFYRKHLMTLLTLLILFAGSTSKTVMRDIKAFFLQCLAFEVHLFLHFAYSCRLLVERVVEVFFPDFSWHISKLYRHVNRFLFVLKKWPRFRVELGTMCFQFMEMICNLKN